MEPVRFADVLFILLACLVTFGILVLVNRKRTDPKKGEPQDSGLPDENIAATKPQSDNDNN